MACLLDENSYCVGPDSEILEPINPNCTENSCRNFFEEESSDSE